MNEGGIYAITSTMSGKVYIGSTVNLEKRWSEHWGNLRRGVHSNPHLQSAWNKYGETTFEFGVLEYLANLDQLHLAEQFWMDVYREEGRKLYNCGLVARSPRLGRKHTDEARRNMSRAQKGRVHTKEQHRKIGEAHKGKIISEEQRQMLSDLLGKPYPAFIHEGTGEIIPEGRNLLRLCRERELLHSRMLRVARCKSRDCKGWVLLNSTKEWEHGSAKPYPAFIHLTTGNIIPEGRNLAKMCCEKGLSYNNMYRMSKGGRKSCYGWTLLNPIQKMT